MRELSEVAALGGGLSGHRSRGRSGESEYWVPRVTKLNKEGDRTHVLMTDCYRDSATTNATELSEPLGAGGQEVLENL